MPPDEYPDEHKALCLVPKTKKFEPPSMTWDEVMNYITNTPDAHFPDTPEVDTIEVEDEIL